MADNDVKEVQKDVQIAVPADDLEKLYSILYKREWDTKAFKNPITVMRSLLHYGRVAALRIADLFGQLDESKKHAVALELRVEELEKFKSDIEAQSLAAAGEFEAMMAKAAAGEAKPSTAEAKPEAKPSTAEAKPEAKPSTAEAKPEAKPSTAEAKPEAKPAPVEEAKPAPIEAKAVRPSNNAA